MEWLNKIIKAKTDNEDEHRIAQQFLALMKKWIRLAQYRNHKCQK
jgi:hypothetical protein